MRLATMFWAAAAKGGGVGNGRWTEWGWEGKEKGDFLGTAWRVGGKQSWIPAALACAKA